MTRAEKVTAILTEGRLSLYEVHEGTVLATVIGSTGTRYMTGCVSGEWNCTCKYVETTGKDDCSHLLAIRKVVASVPAPGQFQPSEESGT